jgi:hypothetical protein
LQFSSLSIFGRPTPSFISSASADRYNGAGVLEVTACDGNTPDHQTLRAAMKKRSDAGRFTKRVDGQ